MELGASKEEAVLKYDPRPCDLIHVFMGKRRTIVWWKLEIWLNVVDIIFHDTKYIYIFFKYVQINMFCILHIFRVYLVEFSLFVFGYVQNERNNLRIKRKKMKKINLFM